MKITQLRPRHFLTSLIFIISPYGLPISPIPIEAAKLSVSLYFLQLFSYVFKLEGLDFTDSKMVIFSNIVFYSNFANILAFFQSEILTFLAYFISFALLTGFYVFWTFVTIVQFLGKSQMFLKNRIFMVFHMIFSRLISLYYWVILTPLLELFVNILSDAWPFYNEKIRDFSALTYTFSIIGLFLAIFLAFALFWLNRNDSFMTQDFLKTRPSFPLFVVLILRIIVVVGFVPIKSTALGNLIFFLLIAIGVLRFIDFLLGFSIIHQGFSRAYFAILGVFLVFVSYFTYLALKNAVADSGTLYELGFMSILISKLASKIQENIYNSIMASGRDSTASLSAINFIEEFFRFFQNKTRDERQAFFCGGVLGTHARRCDFKECPLKSLKTEFAKNPAETQDVLVRKLLGEFFLTRARTKEDVRKKEESYYETLLIKYVSFSARFNFTELKAFFEIQNILKLAIHSKSFYFHHATRTLLKGIQEELKSEIETSSVEFHSDQKEIPLKVFFQMLREKALLQRKLSALLAKRLAFWERYKEGFQSYESVIWKSSGLVDEILEYKELLGQRLRSRSKENTQNVIFALKFHSIFSCVVVNNINEGVQLEDKLDKIMRRELTLEQSILNCHSFFNEKLVILQCSFLHLDGRLLDSCKTAKLANFFKYSLEELRNIRTLQSLMPKFIAEIHNDLVARTINDAKGKKKKKVVESFAEDKFGFIFPVKIYVTQNFQTLHDLVYEAAVMNRGYDSEQVCLIDRNGILQGMTKSFLEAFQSVQNVDKQLESRDFIGILNFFCLVPNLEAVFKDNVAEGESLRGEKRIKSKVMRNLSALIKIPVSFHVIMDILKEKIKEDLTEKFSSQSHSSKSKASQHNNSKTSRFLSLFFSTIGNVDGSSKNAFEEKFIKRQLTNIEVLRKMIETQKCRVFKVLYNLSFSGAKTKHKELVFAAFAINKLSKVEESAFGNEEGASEGLHDDLELVMPRENRVNFKTLHASSNTEEEKSNVLSDQVKNTIMRSTLKGKGETIKDVLSSSIKFEEDLNNRLFTTEGDQEVNLLSQDQDRQFQSLEAPRTVVKSSALHLSQEKIKQLTKNSDSRSRDSAELRKYHNDENKGRTSLQRVYDVVDRSSQASSLSSLKKTFSIFNMIRLIQNILPSNIRNLGFLQVLQFLVLLIYCIVIYESCLKFMVKYYNPLQDSLANYANIFASYSRSNLLMQDLRLMNDGVLDSGSFADYYNLYKQIFDEDFQDIRLRVNNERKKATEFLYQERIVRKTLSIVNLDKNVVEGTLLMEFLGQINEYMYSIKESDLNQLSQEKMYYFSVNFPEFNDFYVILSDEIEREFVYYMQVIADQVQAVMIGFICLILLVKALETVQVLILLARLTKLLNIFLRINANEALTEALLTKQVVDSLKDPFDRFMTVDYPEKVSNRKTVVSQIEDGLLNRSSGSNHQKSMKTKKKMTTAKKFSLHNLRSFSKLPLILYICFSFSLIFAYLFFNFYFAEVITKDQIQNLISVTSFFENLFTAPATVFTMTNILYFDKLYGLPLYKTSQADFQQEVYSNLIDKVKDTETINKDIPKYGYYQAKSMADSLVSLIINGNGCEALREHGYLTDFENSLCLTNFNGAFQKGLVNVISMIQNDVNSQQSLLSLDQSSLTAEAQKDGIRSVIAALGWNNSKSLTNHFFNKAAKIIFENLNEYYGGQIQAQLDTMEQVLLSTSVSIMILVLLAIYLTQRVLTKIYRNVTVLLNLIPFEKLINDEQTSFLIKKVLRE